MKNVLAIRLNILFQLEGLLKKYRILLSPRSVKPMVKACLEMMALFGQQ